LHNITGEHPHSAGQQVAKGAIDAGAAAMRAPSAVGGSQVNFLPANTDPKIIVPADRQTVFADGCQFAI